MISLCLDSVTRLPYTTLTSDQVPPELNRLPSSAWLHSGMSVEPHGEAPLGGALLLSPALPEQLADS